VSCCILKQSRRQAACQPPNSTSMCYVYHYYNWPVFGSLMMEALRVDSAISVSVVGAAVWMVWFESMLVTAQDVKLLAVRWLV
jgi:hypothetical protein